MSGKKELRQRGLLGMWSAQRTKSVVQPAPEPVLGGFVPAEPVEPAAAAQWGSPDAIPA